MSQQPICFYHSADFDGLCSGAIVKRFAPDVELVGYDYDQDFPWEKVAGREVYMVDVSLPPADMQRICDDAKSFTWIDHHPRAITSVLDAEVGPMLTNCRVEDYPGRKISACELTWEWFAPDVAGEYPDPKLPLAVHLLGRYDVWDHEGEPRAMPFQYGARAKILGGVDDLQWSELLDPDMDRLTHDILEAGYQLWHYQQSEDAKVARACCFDAELDGLKILACNRGLTNSSLFDTVWDPEKYHAMSPFYLNKRGQWKVSLYTTREDVDCSEIAKRYGGGGHQKAAGFHCEKLPWVREVTP